MKFKLSYKIFAIFTAMAFVVVVLMTGLIWFYFSSNFEDYSNRVKLENHKDVNIALRLEYQKVDSWHGLKNNTDKWEIIIESNSPWFKTSQGGSNIMVQNQPSLDPAALLEYMARKFAVFDTDLQLIVGGNNDSHTGYTLAEISLDGEVIGWLGLHKTDHLSNLMAKGFLAQQLHGFYLIGCGVLLVAAVVTFLLSRQLLKPIRELTKGTHALALRKFDTRINIKSSDELGQLAGNFNHTAKTLKQYETLRQKWISDIAHELRTPLQILSGEIEALKDGVRDIDISAMESLYAEAQHLGKIVNDLHELSMADTGAFTFNKVPVDPNAVLQETLEHFKPLFVEKQIRLENRTSDLPISKILCDQTRLKQLFSNLFQNALEYMDMPGIVRVQQNHHENHVVLSIEDSGPGVPEEELSHLFDRLYRVDKSRNRKHGGSGLGLSICKSIVSAFGGDIRAVTGDLGGLKIEITFQQVDRNAT